MIQDGAVIGSDGFGFAHRDDGTHEKIPQVATVVIEDDVEIGANTTIDRPAVGETRIRPGTKIDNLVQIAHGVLVGKNALLAAQVGIAGSTVIGDDVMFGGQVGVTGHVTVGSRVKASAKTGVTGNVAADLFITGLSAHGEPRVAEGLRRGAPAARVAPAADRPRAPARRARAATRPVGPVAAGVGRPAMPVTRAITDHAHPPDLPTRPYNQVT